MSMSAAGRLDSLYIDLKVTISDMDIKRVQEVFGEDDDSITRDDDSIPLADENPSDVLDESLISEDKRKVNIVTFKNILIN